jgi:hypothetical protein
MNSFTSPPRNPNAFARSLTSDRWKLGSRIPGTRVLSQDTLPSRLWLRRVLSQKHESLVPCQVTCRLRAKKLEDFGLEMGNTILSMSVIMID